LAARAGIVDRTGRRVLAGHADGGHILFAQGVDSDGGNQRRIDASAQPHQHLGKTALADVVAGAQNQRLVDCRVLAGVDRAAIAGQRRAVEKDQVFGKGPRLGDDRAIGTEGETGSVKNQAVVAAHLVDHHHGSAMAPGNRGQHAVAQFPLTAVVR